MGYVLLAGRADDGWLTAARAAVGELGLSLDAHVVGAGDVGDPDAAFPDAYGISTSGAVLIRPDGVVGRRAVDGDGASETAVREVLAQLLCRNDQPGG